MTPPRRKDPLTTSIHRNKDRLSRETRQAVQDLCWEANQQDQEGVELHSGLINEMVEKLVEMEQDDLVKDNPRITRNTKIMVKGYVQKQLGKNR